MLLLLLHVSLFGVRLCVSRSRLFGAARPSLLPSLVSFLAPFCARPLLVYRHPAIAALQGAAAALHVVNLTPSAYLTVADASGNRYLLPGQQQQQQQGDLQEGSAPAAAAAAAAAPAPNQQQQQQQQQHTCSAWTALLPGGFLSSLTAEGAATAAAAAAAAGGRGSPPRRQETLPPAQRMQRLLAVATDAAVDAAAMTLEDLQPQVLRLEILFSPGGAAAAAAATSAAEAAAESWLAAEALHSLRSALGCLQALTHLWVGLHWAAAEAAGGLSAVAADRDAGEGDTAAAATAAIDGPIAAFGDASRALRVLEILEVVRLPVCCLLLSL